MQGRPQQVPQPNQIYLKTLQDHLILHIFNMLDNKSRINGFRAIGWSTTRYVQRRENMRKQIEMKKKNEKEMKERKEWREGLFKNVLNAGVKDGDIVGEDKREEENETAEGGEEKKESGTEKEDKVEVPTDEMAEVSISNETKEDEEYKEILPHLGMRVDPITLLCRLNTRRLHGRIKYYRKLEKDQKEEEEREKKDRLAKGLEIIEPSIVEMYDRDLKDNMRKQRIYPKNMTVMQMAQKEWNELIQMANYR